MTDPTAAFDVFVPGFDFLQGLAKGGAAGMPPMQGVPNWIAPTFDVEEIDKRIQELKAVQFWLEQNGTALKATIQALEVQKMTLTTLQGMNVNMTELAKAFTARAPDATATATAPEPAPQSEMTPAPERAARAAPKAKRASKPKADQPANGAAVDPMQWWGSLTQQFQNIASAAMQDVAAQAMKDKASSAASDTAAAGNAKTPAKKPVRKKPAAPKARTARS